MTFVSEGAICFLQADTSCDCALDHLTVSENIRYFYMTASVRTNGHTQATGRKSKRRYLHSRYRAS